MRITQKQIDEGWKLVGGRSRYTGRKGHPSRWADATGSKPNIVETTRNEVKAQVKNLKRTSP